MDETVATLLFIRTNSTSTDNPIAQTRPHVYKSIGIALAIASGNFIGVSFVLKKIGLLKANTDYGEAAGEGYGYLKNSFWWSGMLLMIIGEVCNFVAYAFVDAILVTPLGALSVVITTILSAIFLKERLSMVGKVGCFLCIIGSIVIVMNAPAESSVANIQEMQNFVIAPGFLAYATVIILACLFVAIWIAPRFGKKSMMVYISICSLIGGLSVVATQGLGAAIVAQIGGTSQFNQWFLYVLFLFVIATLFTEVIYLNKALNLFNAALVTPTYYVFFTSSTIITSAILFRGFHGSVTSIINVVNGFLVICAGVSLLQLSKSAKDVPDTAIFAGDLDQVRTIGEQEQPESEPKADAIRGTAAILRKISSARQRWELDEAKRLHEEKKQDLRPMEEGDVIDIQWDGLRRRTTLRNAPLRTQRVFTGDSSLNIPPTQHPPLGMSRFPPESDSNLENEASMAGGIASSIFGSISRHRKTKKDTNSGKNNEIQSQNSTQIVPLTDISIPDSPGLSSHEDAYHAKYGYRKQYAPMLSSALKAEPSNSSERGTESRSSDSQNISNSQQHPATRQFSFQSIFRKVSNSPSQLNAEDQIFSRPLTAKKSPDLRSVSISTVRGLDYEEDSIVNSESSSVRHGEQISACRDEKELVEKDCVVIDHRKSSLGEGGKEEVTHILEDISEEEHYENYRKN
ncbi:hypothetical protein Golomagni_03728 [Golovinomyces magnicellulatus]|nr:hypothetical protein Golomagni_03728 [Golovinomyces magnicellulatus]